MGGKMNYFDKKETSCRCGCGYDIQDRTRAMLNKTREACGFPLIVNSGARCESWNLKQGGAKQSDHLKGLACDIQFKTNEQLFQIIKYAIQSGFNRLFLYGEKGFIHLGYGNNKENIFEVKE